MTGPRLGDPAAAGGTFITFEGGEGAGKSTQIAHLAATLAPIFRAHSSAEWLARLEAGGVPAGPVLDVNAMHRDPQALAREMVVEVDHPRVGRMKTLGLPVKFSETPGRVHGPAPLLGEHSRAILAEAGYAPAEIDALIARGVVRETAA